MKGEVQASARNIQNALSKEEHRNATNATRSHSSEYKEIVHDLATNTSEQRSAAIGAGVQVSKINKTIKDNPDMPLKQQAKLKRARESLIKTGNQMTVAAKEQDETLKKLVANRKELEKLMKANYRDIKKSDKQRKAAEAEAKRREIKKLKDEKSKAREERKQQNQTKYEIVPVEKQEIVPVGKNELTIIDIPTKKSRMNKKLLIGAGVGAGVAAGTAGVVAAKKISAAKKAKKYQAAIKEQIATLQKAYNSTYNLKKKREIAAKIKELQSALAA